MPQPSPCVTFCSPFSFIHCFFTLLHPILAHALYTPFSLPAYRHLQWYRANCAAAHTLLAMPTAGRHPPHTLMPLLTLHCPLHSNASPHNSAHTTLHCPLHSNASPHNSAHTTLHCPLHSNASPHYTAHTTLHCPLHSDASPHYTAHTTLHCPLHPNASPHNSAHTTLHCPLHSFSQAPEWSRGSCHV